MRSYKRHKKYLVVLTAVKQEDDKLELFGQIGTSEPATRPLVPICLPVTAEECAAVVRKLWGGVDPVGNGWAAYPLPLAGGMGDGKSGNGTTAAGTDEERWSIFLAKRASEGDVAHRLG